MLRYRFDTDRAGEAAGIITVTPSSNTAARSGYYLLYFANDDGLLVNFDEFASIPITGDVVTHIVKRGTLLPPETTKLVAFESDSRFLDKPPLLKTAFAAVDLPAKKRLFLGAPEFIFGAVADVHMNYQRHDRGAYEKWTAALAFFHKLGADCVIVAGDVTGDAFENPLERQYEQYERIIAASLFPRNKIFESIGNHGNTAEGRAVFVSHLRGEGARHPFVGSPWYAVHKKGKTADARDNLFLFMAQEIEAPGETAWRDNFSKAQIDWLEEALVSRADTDTNIFIIEHAPFLNIGPGDRRGGDYKGVVRFIEDYPQTMRLKNLLKTHKRVIVLSGHTHLSFYDGENYSDENGSFCRMIHIGSCCQPTSYGTGNKLIRNTDGRHDVTPAYGSEVYLVAVYAERIIFTGYNLSTNKVIPSACFTLDTNLQNV